MADNSQGFWSTVPGILTGIAAVITASTGLYLAIKESNSETPPVISHLEVTAPPSTEISQEVIEPDKKPTQALPAPLHTQPLATAAPTSGIETQHQEKPPFPESGPLVDCTLFPTINSVTSLMSWSNHYHKQVIAADGIKGRATDPCNQTIDYRGMAHCKDPGNHEVRQALLDTLTLCRAAGIEWRDIQHSTILGQ